MATIPSLSIDAPVEKMQSVLQSAGCLVVTGAADEQTVAALRTEMAPHMQQARIATQDDPAEFYPAHTRRVSALVGRSETARNLVMDPMVLALCDHFLLPNSNPRYQLHVSAALEIGPGAREQILHREEDPFSFFPLPRPNLVLATMWAMSDFSKENGGTLLVPGSHLWEAARKPEPDEIVAAEMPKGAVLFWMGGLLHGAGANVSDEWRYGVILTYSLGWLRQEENQSLAIPQDVVRDLSPELRDMIGDTMNGSLGFADKTLHRPDQ
jgi:ectoine hydroxylase-related dioxygenase (phytanoyl-CoA dioxygenase family)